MLRQWRKEQYLAPKTVLGFYAGVLVILEAGIAVVLTILTTTDSLLYLVPWVLAFGGLLLVALLAVVVTMNVKSPTKLQLGEVPGKDFLEHEQVMRGDSIAGEFAGPAPSVRPTEINSERPAIETATDVETDQEGE